MALRGWARIDKLSALLRVRFPRVRRATTASLQAERAGNGWGGVQAALRCKRFVQLIVRCWLKVPGDVLRQTAAAGGAGTAR